MHRPALIIGSFDGVHLGHAALIRRAMDAGSPVIALAFDPHPATVLRPGQAPPRLTTFERRTELLRAAGVDRVVRLEPTPVLLSQSPEQFFEWLMAEHAPGAIVEGPDFRFGKGRAGTIATLRELGTSRGVAVHVVEPVLAGVAEHFAAPASSTLVRWLVQHGRMAEAAQVLGRPYEMTGEVVRGDRRGRGIGFPTANLRSDCLPPSDGVYAGVAVLADGRRIPAAISVGTKPTFGEHDRAVEAFLILNRDGDGWKPIDGLPEYGWPVRLEFRAWLRDQAKFESIPALIEQMNRDTARAVDLTMERTCR